MGSGVPASYGSCANIALPCGKPRCSPAHLRQSLRIEVTTTALTVQIFARVLYVTVVIIFSIRLGFVRGLLQHSSIHVFPFHKESRYPFLLCVPSPIMDFLLATITMCRVGSYTGATQKGSRNSPDDVEPTLTPKACL
jgi:hypothetical protein